MEKTSQIKAHIDNDYIHHSVWDLHKFDKKEVFELFAKKEGMAVAFYDDNNFLFAAILDYSGDTIHVREVAGNFGRNFRHLHNFANFAGRILMKTYVTFCTERRAVEKWADRMGYIKNDSGYYVGVIGGNC